MTIFCLFPFSKQLQFFSTLIKIINLRKKILTHLSFFIFLTIEIDVERLKLSPALEFIDLKNNPLTPRLHDLLGAFARIQIEISPRQLEDWEDLSVWVVFLSSNFLFFFENKGQFSGFYFKSNMEKKHYTLPLRFLINIQGHCKGNLEEKKNEKKRLDRILYS